MKRLVTQVCWRAVGAVVFRQRISWHDQQSPLNVRSEIFPVNVDADGMFRYEEFFVLRGLRRTGVGRDAAFLLWNRIPGRWIVRVSMSNSSGLAFWRRAIAKYTGG